METIEVQAMGKINLGLDVLQKLQNGYHEVKMIMQSVRLYDTIRLKKQKENRISLLMDNNMLPCDDRNLAYKAAELLKEKFGVKDGVIINLKKELPVAAGLAGGSADAAAVLTGLNQLFGLGLGADVLTQIGVNLGADVPYCIIQGTALSEGIGEKLTILEPAPHCFVLLAKPDISVSTRYVYESLDLAHLTQHPDIEGMIQAIKKQDITAIAARMDNVLESVTVKKYPIIETIKNKMKENGALNAIMSGSGPTVFGLFDKEENAYSAKEAIQCEGLAAFIRVTEFCRGRDFV